MTNTLFDEPFQWPEAALDSIYKLYPRKENRKAALKRINEALSRIAMGEIDGKPRTIEESIAFLRAKTEDARQEFAGREECWIPHPTTFFHQRKYLRPKNLPEQLPMNLAVCISILAAYPLSPSQRHIENNPKPFMPTLLVIDKAIIEVGAGPILGAVCNYAHAVSSWPIEDRQYIPSALRWFNERRFEQNPAIWERKARNGHYEEGRSQIRRLNS